MEILLAWAVYLTLGVVCLTLGWAWFAPRLPRRVRLAILGLFAGLSVLATSVTAQFPHDYRPGDLAEYDRGQAALLIGLLIAVVGGTAALAAIGRRRTQNAGLCGAGVYLAGVGLVLYWMLNGQPTLQAPTLLMVGATLALAGACRLVGLPCWAARAFGPATGLMVALVGEALRGMGSRGGGPATASREVLSLAAIGALLLLLGGVRLLRSQGRVLASPLSQAAAGLGGTGLVLVLRGPGEWAPGPGASSTTLYGLPLTVLVVAVSLAIVESPAKVGRAHGWRLADSGSQRTAQAWPLVVGLLLLFGLMAIWHPALEACVAVPYAESSPLTPGGPTWALSPDPSAPRGAPEVSAFDQLCTHRTPNVSQVVYAYYPSCKWAQVDTNYPLVQASGTLRQIDLSHGDSPWIHTSHDLELDLAVDQASSWLVIDGTPGALLHVEAEAGSFPVGYRPVIGDRVTVAGRWIFDCGHDPATEIHPAAIVASEHDEWRADASGGPRQVRVLQVWMNSAPGVVHVPLAPFDLRAGFPSQTAGQVATPMVQVVAGPSGSVQWTIEAGVGAGAGPEAGAAVHIAPPGPQGSAYFELLLGYQEAAAPPRPPISYTVAFDRLIVRDNLRHKARNTTGVPIGLSFPQLGFAGTGHWTMQAIVGHAWRSLLDDAPVESDHTYSLAAAPPVPILAPGDERLRLAITGYAENDPSGGVELASGSVDGAALVSWDAGQLADLCCGREQTFTPTNNAWTLSYHVSRAVP